MKVIIKLPHFMTCYLNVRDMRFHATKDRATVFSSKREIEKTLHAYNRAHGTTFGLKDIVMEGV